MPLEPTPLPAADPRAKNRGAVAFRHVTPGATVYVAVCPQRCPVTRFRPEPGQRWRLGMDSNNNVPISVTESDRRAGTRLLEALAEPMREVHPYIDSDSRCYIR